MSDHLSDEVPEGRGAKRRFPGVAIRSGNVVMVGSMGAGKTTLARFLAFLGLSEQAVESFSQDEMIQLCLGKAVRASKRVCAGGGPKGDALVPPSGDGMRVGHSGAAGTTQTCVYCFKFEHIDGTEYQINFIDTPGLHEPDAQKDVDQMLDMLRSLRDRGEIHFVLFCQPWNARLTLQEIKTFEYYERLLQPLFTSGKVAMIGTKVGEADYGDDAETQEEFLQTAYGNLDAVVDTLKNKRLVQVRKVFAAKMLRTVLDAGCKSVLAGEEPAHPAFAMSFQARQELLRFLHAVAAQPGVRVDEHFFPLPPSMDRRREAQILVLQGRLRQLVETVRVMDELMSSQLADITKICDEIAALLASICEHQELLAHKCNKSAVTEALCRFGQDRFRLLNEAEASIFCPAKEFALLVDKWNCSYQQTRIVYLPSGGCNVYFVIKPNLITWSQKSWKGDMCSWFMHIALVYDNETVFPEDVATLKALIAEMEAKMQCLEAQRAQLLEQKSGVQSHLDQHKADIAKHEADLMVLRKGLYNVDEVFDVVHLLPCLD